MTNKMGLEEAESEDSHKMENIRPVKTENCSCIWRSLSRSLRINPIENAACLRVLAANERDPIKPSHGLRNKDRRVLYCLCLGRLRFEPRLDVLSHSRYITLTHAGGFGPQYFQSTMDMLLYDAVLATQAAKEFSPPWRNDACLGFNPCPCQI
uniref:Uncharacterized protein n=1 Tax=Timema bartmani TaxID=61472 RepID=A0A7R9I3E1_9NEOP|nr:unnamed protein product [Timema bartmani]